MSHINSKDKVLIYAPYINPNKTGKAIFDELFYNNVYRCICGRITPDSLIRYGKVSGIYNNTDNGAMLRCFCNSCNMVLLVNTTQIISEQMVEEMYGKLCVCAMKVNSDEPTGNEVFLLIDVAYIFNIVNTRLRKYKIDKMIDYTKYLGSITLPPIIKIINKYLQFGSLQAYKLSEYEETKREYYDRNISMIKKNKFTHAFDGIVDIINKYDLTYVHTMDNEPKNNPYFWNVSLPVNSYNLHDPKNPYPTNFNIVSYGGTHILYLDENGNKQTIHFME